MPDFDSEHLFARYRELQRYADWTDDDAARVHALAPLLHPALPALVNDFYAEIERHPQAARVITGGREQVERLKGTLIRWLEELLSGKYDAEYVIRRWRVGDRHVEIGLDQVYTNMALSRLRIGLMRVLADAWQTSSAERLTTLRSLHKLLDLDLAIIEDAYQAQYLARQQRAERLAAIGQVAGGIAHELRNPLNVIKTSVYYLLNARNPGSAKILEHLERIQKQVGMADGVITALSNFARLPLPNMQPFELRPCIEETLGTFAVPENVRIEFDFDHALPPAVGDQSQLQIVFRNLIRNAIDAMPQGGTVTIRASTTAEGLFVSVSDTGSGISAENLTRVREPLFTTTARGIGLGLAMARAIVEKHLGRILVDSPSGAGATFTVQLPAA